jgi:small conductance mechanosensitive channel
VASPAPVSNPAVAGAPNTTSAADFAQKSSFDAALAGIAQARTDLSGLQPRLDAAQGLLQRLLSLRTEQKLSDLIRRIYALAQDVSRVDPSLPAVQPYRAEVIRLLLGIPADLDAGTQRLRTELNALVSTSDGAKPADQAALDSRRSDIIDRQIALQRLALTDIDWLKRYNQDVTALNDRLRARLADSAESTAMFLELSTQDLRSLRLRQREIPQDADLKASVSVAEQRVRSIAARLDALLDVMQSAGMNVSGYRQEMIAATGEITTDILDLHVVSGLAHRAGAAARSWVIDDAPTLILRLILVVLIVFLTRAGARLARTLTARAFDKSVFGTTALRRHIVISTSSKVVIAVGIFLALAQLGFSAGNLLAGLGVAGIIVGLALQNTLSNFTAGLLILVYRPFDIGDDIEVAGMTGNVRGMTLANTTLAAGDNQIIVIPNNSVWSNIIKNSSISDLRRIDMTFAVPYADDVATVEALLRRIVTEHPKVLPDPAAVVRLNALAESSMSFIVRPWTHRLNYWDVYWDITRAVKLRFDQEGILNPAPQRRVFHSNEAAPQTPRSSSAAPTE